MDPRAVSRRFNSFHDLVQSATLPQGNLVLIDIWLYLEISICAQIHEILCCEGAFPFTSKVLCGFGRTKKIVWALTFIGSHEHYKSFPWSTMFDSQCSNIAYSVA